jgi:hypothetical protein
MSDHFDMPDQPQSGETDDQKQREEHAYELADYIRKHPTAQDLRYRVAVLTGKNFADEELDRLMPEIHYWLELADWQDEANS